MLKQVADIGEEALSRTNYHRSAKKSMVTAEMQYYVLKRRSMSNYQDRSWSLG